MIELTDITKTVRERNGETRTLFDGLDLSLPAGGGSLAIMGRSGSGKTSLLRILAGLDPDYTGSYRVDGTELPRQRAALARYRLAHIGYVTQHYDLLEDRDVLANVAFAAPRRRGSREQARACLQRVGMGRFAHARVTALSGGEAQRVAIARALVKRPRLILADEPTGALDEGTEREILSLFAQLRTQGTSLIVATHSPRVAEVCETTLRLSRRRLVASQPEE